MVNRVQPTFFQPPIGSIRFIPLLCSITLRYIIIPNVYLRNTHCTANERCGVALSYDRESILAAVPRWGEETTYGIYHRGRRRPTETKKKTTTATTTTPINNYIQIRFAAVFQNPRSGCDRVEEHVFFFIYYIRAHAPHHRQYATSRRTTITMCKIKKQNHENINIPDGSLTRGRVYDMMILYRSTTPLAHVRGRQWTFSSIP